MSCIFSTVCSIIVVFQFIKNVIPWFYQNIFGPLLYGSKVDLKNMGEWALITGATEGIGKSYAKALAKKGLKLVLVSRSLEKLERVSKEISEEFNVEVKVIDADFTHGPEIYEKIEKNIIGLEIGVLVNNVGMSYSYPKYFLEVANNTFLLDIVSCNINSVTHMCKIILPGMVERKKGVIINIASLAAVIPNPLLAVYSATKAFVDKFSGDLAIEYKQHGIIVQSVLPGFVATNMSKIKKPTMMSPAPDTYVSSALNTLGISTHTTGYFPHALLKLTVDIMRAVTCTAFTNNFLFKQLQNIANRSSRKVKGN